MKNLLPGIAQLQESYRQVVYDKDIASFICLHDPSARVFDAFGVWQYEGTEKWRGAIEGWFSSLGEDRCDVTFDETKADGTPDFCTASMIVTYASVTSAGERTKALQNRLTWVLRGGAIIHEHTSAPIGFEDMTAILQRPRDE